MLSENIRRSFSNVSSALSLFRNEVSVEHFFSLSQQEIYNILWSSRTSDFLLLFDTIATKKISINGVCRSKTQIYLGGAWPVRGFDDRKIAFVKIQRTRLLMNGT